MLLLFACAHSVPRVPPVPAPAPQPPSDLPSELGFLTMDQCTERGGEVKLGEGTDWTCYFASSKNGDGCRDATDCAGGECYCTGALGRPNPADNPALAAFDGTAGTGTCSDRGVPEGLWFCLVVDGKIRLDGIIVN